ncbi:alpha/beta hydrolase family protein [Pararhodobacter sp. SW119]|uniref:alpha/beta hydrolase family protein n=1 Tax=Pararhodobacter sp. SW119 TaxID=2780075 RepID=UPI001ADF677A|nr:alpha/beta hydrolase family protein [Pararhodobacter sp. SW119]
MRLLLVLFLLLPLPARADCVVLMHGLSRTDSSMWLIAETLEYHGYRVINYHYPSTDEAVENLVRHVGFAVNQCGFQQTHFVTHSLGGILVRAWLSEERPALMGRVVMLAPPNHGTEIVDNLAENELFHDIMTFMHGPAVVQLGTDAGSILNQLPEPDYELGIVAGNRAISPLGPFLIEGENDGTVSVESTRVAGMTDHIVLPATHAMIMMNPIAIAEVVEFLRYGAFDHGITLASAIRKLANP